MSLTLGSRPQHLEDVDLVRYMDRQMDRAGTRRTELHLVSCAECAARMQAMDARSRQVSDWLGEMDVPVADEQRALAMAAVQRARFRARPFEAFRVPMAAAAMVALMLTVAFGTAPGRAWVSRAAERIAGVLPGEAEQAPAAAPAPDAAARTAAAPGTPGAPEADALATPSTARVQRQRRPVLPPGMSEPVPFNPPGNYVLLKFDSRQRVGAATLWIRSIPTASGQVVAGRQSESLTPTADGLRVRNVPGSRADYTVEVPNRYRFIRVQVGDEPETIIEVSRSRHDWTWNLSLSGNGG